jgi:hypothetical protein
MKNRGENAHRIARKPVALALLIVMILGAMSILIANRVAAVAVVVPYSPTPVADADLDGNPATGVWGDAGVSTVPLENGEAGAYGQATLRVKHDGTYAYFRIDGSIDVAWTSAAGNHFWLGFELSAATGNHHGGGTWDGCFIGLWNGAQYTPQPTYPPPAVDTNGFAKPPAKDAVQNLLGTMRYTGAAAPFAFTAEWKRLLSTGDTNDITYVADGSTQYNFYMTTDSDGGGSNGGAIDHSATTNSNSMRFAVAPGNTPPTVDLTAPNGGETWTGATSHMIRWNMSDAETATTSLRVWLNYSIDGGAGWSPIAGAQGISGISNPATYAWTVPAVNTVQARVRVTVADAAGATAVDSSLANFAIDSTPPTVTAFSPLDGASGVSPATTVRVTFSEAMNQPSAQTAFSLQRIDTGYYVPGAFSWSVNDLTFTPSGLLAQGFTYRTRVNASARDISDTGNQMAGAAMASFTTADMTPPSILTATATPSPQEIGLPVNVSASVTDNGLLSGVWIEVKDPLGTSMGNNTAGHDISSGRYFREQSCSKPGAYTYHISAADASGNWATADGGFTMVDTQTPIIQHVPVSQALRTMPIRITATISDVDSVADARINYTDVLGAMFNVSMPLNGTKYEYDIPGQSILGNVLYFVWAVDPSGNAARTVEYTIAIVDADLVPPVVASVTATPPVQNASFSVNITALVTDNVAVQSITVVVTDPLGGTLGNFTMTQVGASDTYYFERVYTTLGTYSVVVWATDGSLNHGSASGSFVVVDLMPPFFVSVSVIPPTQEVFQQVNITASVTDNVAVSSVSVNIFDPVGGAIFNGLMNGGAGNYWHQSSYSSLGLFTFVVTATDGSGNQATRPGDFTIADTQPPVANAGPDGNVGVGTLVSLDGSASTDNFGIANYTWTFTDIAPVTIYGAIVTYTFNNVGSFFITLTIKDQAGNPGTDNAWVNVTAVTPLVAEAGPGQTVPQGTLVTLDGSGSTSGATIENYTWTFVDGASVELWGVTVQHRFMLLANVTVHLDIEDSLGNEASDTTWVNVIADTVPPIANAGPDKTINLGQGVTLDGSASTDDVYIANYTWLVLQTSEDLYGAVVSCQPNAAGVWQFTLTVMDASGLMDTDVANVTVIFTDTTPPSEPSDLEAVTYGPGSIRVTWEANQEPDLSGYILYRAESASGPFIRINAALLQTTTYIDTGLVAEKRYWYVVHAVDVSGNVSPPSEKADAVAGAYPPAEFAWGSIMWALIPISMAVILVYLALMAGR